MRCKFCGTTLPDHAKFCPGCGKEIDNDRERHESREASNIPEDAYYTNTNKKNSKRKRRHKKISVRFIIVYLIVVLTGGFCLYRMGFPEKVVEMLSKQSSVPDSKKEISQKSDKKKNNENEPNPRQEVTCFLNKINYLAFITPLRFVLFFFACLHVVRGFLLCVNLLNF